MINLSNADEQINNLFINENDYSNEIIHLKINKNLLYSKQNTPHFIESEDLISKSNNTENCFTEWTKPKQILSLNDNRLSKKESDIKYFESQK